MKILNKLNKISESIFFKGKIFQKGKLLNNDDVISLLCNVHSPKELSDIIADFTGFFYLGIELENSIILATDIVRTHPVFYKTSDSTIYLSENAFDLRENETISLHDADGFLMCGYVIGNKTIFQDIFQVETANIVSISKKDGKVSCFQHYHLSSSLKETMKEECFSELNTIYENAVRRLIDYAKGRTIVVPLSAGHDSRLIVMLLKRLGVENVICYTYGATQGYDVNQWEIEISKKVAESLGYRWICISYSYSKWNKLFNSAETGQYINYASCGISLISHQDWLAVCELKSRELIPEDSVFVPGHSGDFIAGSHIPKNIRFDDTYEWNDIINTNRDKHFNQFALSKNKKTEFCKSFFSPAPSLSAVDYIHELETFNWKERQSKHICHTARLYEFYGYDWYFPLWDKELVDFWYSIHPKERLGRKLYFEFIERYFKSSIPYRPNQNFFLRVLFKLCKVLKFEFLIDNQYGIFTQTKFSLFFKEISIPNEIKDSFVLKNSSRKLRKISINGFGSLLVLLNNNFVKWKK